MKINALMMDEKDNVVTCICEVGKGETVSYKNGDSICQVIAKEPIPYCHKVAIAPVKCGEMIVKYGETIGAATQDIPEGGWVSHLNIESLPRDYDQELI